MNNNKTIYCWQIDTTRKENILKATDGDSSRAIKVGDKVHATTAKKAKEPKFVEFDYSYYASPVPATDSMFCIKDTVDNKEEEYGTINVCRIAKKIMCPNIIPHGSLLFCCLSYWL